MNELINLIQEQADHHIGNLMAMPYGCNWSFEKSLEELKDYMNIVGYVNRHNKANIKLVMSTPSIYL